MDYITSMAIDVAVGIMLTVLFAAAVWHLIDGLHFPRMPKTPDPLEGQR